MERNPGGGSAHSSIAGGGAEIGESKMDKLKRFLRLRHPLGAQLMKAFVDFMRALRNYFLFIHSRRWCKLYCLRNGGRAIKLNIGAGDLRGENCWLTVDMTSNCDVYWDLRNGLPFPDESVTTIYSSHLLEHLSYGECQELLADSMRVLIPGGVFSACVPDSSIAVGNYIEKREFDVSSSFRQAYNGTTAIDHLNYMAYMDGHHKYMFDEENLAHILKAKGFSSVKMRSFDPSLDDELRLVGSIYVEAVK